MSWELLLTENFMYDMQASNSVKVKKEVLTNYKILTDMLNYVYDPFKKYHITVKQLDKYPELCSDKYISKDSTIYELLDKLTNREVTGHDAIGMINYFISNNKRYEDIIKLIIDKDLKCRIGASIINDVFTGLIPQFKVALAYEYKESMTKKKNWNWSDWLVMRKLDGVRCIVDIDEKSDVKFYSRKGHEFHTLQVIADELKSWGVENIVLDGEVCLIDENDKEDFQTIVGLVKRKDFTVPNPRLIVFDVLTREEFKAGYSPIPYEERIGRYCTKNRLYSGPKTTNVKCLNVLEIQNKDSFERWKEKSAEFGWEGLILRKADSPYEAKRTNTLLKVKAFHDAEYIVEGIENGFMRVVNDETGLEEELELMSSVWINHKGHTVNVGSGFSVDERKYYYKHPEELIGKEITVKYFEETKNQHGGISLRFPTVKKIWTEGKRDV